jgi:hypothetical protein
MVTLTLCPLKFGEFSGFFPKKPFVEVVVSEILFYQVAKFV